MKLPDERIVRCFPKTALVVDLYHFVSAHLRKPHKLVTSHEEAWTSFDIVTTFPALSCETWAAEGATLQSAKLLNASVLVRLKTAPDAKDKGKAPLS